MTTFDGSPHFKYNNKIYMIVPTEDIHPFFSIIDISQSGQHLDVCKTYLSERELEATIDILKKEGAVSYNLNNPNNFNLTGDEARLLIQILTSKDNLYPGNMLIAVAALYQRIFNIHLNQPALSRAKDS